MQATIQPNTVVTLSYRVTDPEGNVLDEGNSDLQYIHGGYKDIPKIEEALSGKAVGDSVTVTLTPEDAFGLHNAEYALAVYRVMEIKGGKAVLDANHPLAGKTLIFACSPVAIRAATDDEIASQTVGGCCGDSECGSCPCGETVH